MGIGGGVLPYLHMIFPVLPAHLLCDFVKQWTLSGMEGQCHMCEALSIIICSHQPKPCPLRLYELPNKLRSLTTRTFLLDSVPLVRLFTKAVSALNLVIKIGHVTFCLLFGGLSYSRCMQSPEGFSRIKKILVFNFKIQPLLCPLICFLL